MESTKYRNLLKGQVIPRLILILLFAASIASADVTISNSYYTSGSESHENVVLHNMDYSNSVSVFSDNYNANAEASTSNQSETSKFTNTVFTNSMSGTQGLGLEARDSNDVAYSRTLVGGSVPFTRLTYDIENLRGEDSPAALQIKYLGPQSLFKNDVSNLANNKYSGTLQSYGARAYLSGKGESNGGASSSFNDTISYVFNGKDCRIESFLKEDQGDEPVDYWWATKLNQGALGETGMDMSASGGNLAKYGIRGFSSVLGEQFSPGVYPGDNTAPPMVPPEETDDDTSGNDEDDEDDPNGNPDIDEILDELFPPDDIRHEVSTDPFLPHILYVLG